MFTHVRGQRSISSRLIRMMSGYHSRGGLLGISELKTPEGFKSLTQQAIRDCESIKTQVIYGSKRLQVIS